MNCDNRGCAWPEDLRPIVLAVALCLAAGGCGWTSALGPGPSDSAPWLSSRPGSKAGTAAFKKQVEADSFPSAADAGV